MCFGHKFYGSWLINVWEIESKTYLDYDILRFDEIQEMNMGACLWVYLCNEYKMIVYMEFLITWLKAEDGDSNGLKDGLL